MIVRCGRCGVELEVSGPGEFACPSCGTRNAVRSGTRAASDPFGAGGLTLPGGRSPAPRPPSPAAEDEPSIVWGTCPHCSWRFAMGEVERITCPSCRANLEVTPQGLVPPA